MFRRRLDRVLCRGVSAVQMVLILSLIAVVAFVGMRTMMSTTSTDMNSTADGLADPAKLADRFLD